MIFGIAIIGVILVISLTYKEAAPTPVTVAYVEPVEVLNPAEAAQIKYEAEEKARWLKEQEEIKAAALISGEPYVDYFIPGAAAYGVDFNLDIPTAEEVAAYVEKNIAIKNAEVPVTQPYVEP